MSLIIYVFLFFLLWWASIGYFIFLNSFSPRGASKNVNPESIDVSPGFFIIVPTYNEEKLIVQKIENLKNLDYSDFKVCFVDASTDKTFQMIQGLITNDSRFMLLRSGRPGRSFQINQALAIADKALIVFTDVDALMDKNALTLFAGEFSEENLGVAGAYVEPASGFNVDQAFWSAQNSMRLLESGYGHVPVVSGACYVFRRELIDKLPEDVWADDIYIPLLANSQGFKCRYCLDIKVKEVRGPGDFKSLIRDKIRKAQDNIKELFRILPGLNTMSPEFKPVYLTRLLQVVFYPLIAMSFLISLFSQSFIVLLLSAIFVGITFLLYKKAVNDLEFSQKRLCLKEIVMIFLITFVVLFVAVVDYIFHQGKVRYVRAS
jgi:cellulose synthase/poly-beta-1,6-N-acetylglucosamine synthase-like glycosyltransferase